MKNCIIAVFLILYVISSSAQETLYEREDSIFIENIIKELSIQKDIDKGRRLLDIADRFIGRSYVAGTLENGADEPLFLSCDKFDCTTFVELVAAIGITMENDGHSISDVCDNLEKIRYRNGRREGYTSRLHYISWWIADSLKQGIIKEVTSCKESRKYRMSLSFMSRNPQGYTMLKDNPAAIKKIEKFEIPFRNKEMEFLPKEILYKGEDELPIKDGDILALTTNIEGLDVTHIGFAFWKNGQLHLLHASSNKGKVIRDDETLFNYQKKRKSQTGIRIFRMTGTL